MKFDNVLVSKNRKKVFSLYKYKLDIKTSKECYKNMKLENILQWYRHENP